jgi:hypothetical protein
MSWIPSLDEFLELPTETVHSLVYKNQWSISLLLNGTRRWYIAEHFDAPPTDNSYFKPYLEEILYRLADLITMVADHGLYRVFLPVYSWYQSERNPTAHKYLMRGIQALVNHPRMLLTYRQTNSAFRFYGNPEFLPEEVSTMIQDPSQVYRDAPSHHIYYGVDGGNPYNYTLQLASAFFQQYGRAPEWEDMLEMYYGDRTINRLEIMVGFNRLYSRGGIPHLLEGGDRIYATVVSPLVLNQKGLRTILYDYLYGSHDFGRDYQDIHPNEIRRLKRFYEANQDTIVGVMRKYEDLVYPLPAIRWPKEMDHIGEPANNREPAFARR